MGIMENKMETTISYWGYIDFGSVRVVVYLIGFSKRHELGC